jgi:hypothetical protein
MKLHFYHLLVLFGLLICRPGAVFAQTTYEGQVLDRNTEAVIPSATVVLSKARIATRTNEQGYFSLYSTSTVEKDSLVFTCVGYKTYRMPVSVYKRGMFITLQSSSTELKEVMIRVRKRTKTLGAFTRDDLDPKGSSLGWGYPVSFYTAQMYAKLFEVPNQNAVVTSIDLGRWQPGPDAWETQPGKTSMFKIHIMTINPANGAPDSILATKEISLQDRSRKISVRFDSTSVILTSTQFFVAVEWLRLPYNEYILKRGFILLEYDKKGRTNTWQNGGFDRMIYQPILAQYKRQTNTTSWQLVNGVWALFKHPAFDFALSATINY